MSTAFVLWGGGSLGAAQVGMLRALTARGVRADMVIGASVGALNGVYYAARPDGDGVEDLARLWLEVGRHDVYPLSTAESARTLLTNLPFHPLRGALQALGMLNYTFAFEPWTFIDGLLGRRNYLFDNHSLAQFLQRMLPIENLQDTVLPVSVLATDVRSGRAVLLSRGRALPSLLASTAIPAIYPTVNLDDQLLMDGGVADHTTLDCAVQAGAQEVYLLAPGFSCHLPAAPSTVISMALHGYNLLNEQRMNASITHNQPRARLHVLPALCPVEVLPIDFTQTADLINRATEATLHWLDHRQPKPGIARTLGHDHPTGHPQHRT